jgi:hypothetical protein
VNLVRVAALLRELADAIEDNAIPEAAGSLARAKRERKPPTLVRPPGEAAPAVAGQAARILRDRGFR